jgi:hypothetical protein
MPQFQLSLELLESRDDVTMEKRAISWYGVKFSPLGEAVNCGKDESCLRYLHLPENLDNVRFDLNRSHPDDDYKQEEVDQTDKISDLLSWNLAVW